MARWAFLFLALAAPALCAQTDYAAALRKNRFEHCAGAINKVANWLSIDEADTLAFWNSREPDARMGSLLLNRKFLDANSISHVSAMRTANSGCEVVFSQSFFLDRGCAVLRGAWFRSWKTFSDIGDASVLEHPAASAVHAVLQPAGSGCLVMRNGTFSYTEAEAEGARR